MHAALATSSAPWALALKKRAAQAAVEVPIPCEELLLTDERVLVPVLAGIAPAMWGGLRRLNRGVRETLSESLIKAALSRMPLLRVTENLCKQLEALVDGATAVLPAGKHRWSGKLRYCRRLRIYGMPGTKITGRVQLAKDSSGTFSDIEFSSGDGGSVRIQDAIWSLERCSIQCMDPDASGVTSVSSRVTLQRCSINCEHQVKSCWVGVLAKGSSAATVEACNIGPHVMRGAVAIDEAELVINGSCINGCEEIGLRLNGCARVSAKSSEFEGAGAALQVGPSSAECGKLDMENCRMASFEMLWGGSYRPSKLRMENIDTSSVGENLDAEGDWADAHQDAVAEKKM